MEQLSINPGMSEESFMMVRILILIVYRFLFDYTVENTAAVGMFFKTRYQDMYSLNAYTCNCVAIFHSYSLLHVSVYHKYE